MRFNSSKTPDRESMQAPASDSLPYFWLFLSHCALHRFPNPKGEGLANEFSYRVGGSCASHGLYRSIAGGLWWTKQADKTLNFEKKLTRLGDAVWLL